MQATSNERDRAITYNTSVTDYSKDAIDLTVATVAERCPVVPGSILVVRHSDRLASVGLECCAFPLGRVWLPLPLSRRAFRTF